MVGHEAMVPSCTRGGLGIRRDFFPVRVVKDWEGLPRGTVESPFLEMLKRCMAWH